MKLKIESYGKWPIIVELLAGLAVLILVNMEKFDPRSLVIFSPIFLMVVWQCIQSSATYTFDSAGVTIQMLNRKKRILWEDFREKQLLCTNKYVAGGLMYHRCARFSLQEKGELRALPPKYNVTWFTGKVWGDVYVYFNDDIPKTMRCAVDVSEEEFLRKLEEWGVTLQTKVIY